MLGESTNSKGSAMRTKVGKVLKKQVLNNKNINVSQAMREAGYSPSSVDCKQKEIRNSKEVINETKDFTDKLDGIIDKSLEDMEVKREQASFRDNVYAVDTLTKTKRLINGESTENQAINISSVLDSLEDSPQDTQN